MYVWRWSYSVLGIALVKVCRYSPSSLLYSYTILFTSSGFSSRDPESLANSFCRPFVFCSFLLNWILVYFFFYKTLETFNLVPTLYDLRRQDDKTENGFYVHVPFRFCGFPFINSTLWTVYCSVRCRDSICEPVTLSCALLPLLFNFK